RGWLRQPGTSHGSRMIIPAGGALWRNVEVEVSSLLTFDNVLIRSAVDVKTGACYTKLIGRQGEPGDFIDTPLDRITSSSTPPNQEPPAEMRATQKRYLDAMERLAETQRNEADKGITSASETNSFWIEKADSEADEQPKYLLYSNQQLLGYSLLERTRSGGQRRGRFHPGEDYFEYSQIFEEFPEAENDCLEANAREAYEIFDEKNEEYRTRFNELAAQVASLKLYVADESGNKIETSEVRLEDLSRYNNDQTERWLYVTVEQPQSGEFSNYRNEHS